MLKRRQGASLFDQIEELVAGTRIFQEHARESGCRRDGIRFFYAAQLHASVVGLDDDGDAQGMQGLLDAVADLDRQALLDLQAPGIGLDDARDLAQAGDLAVGNVGDVRLADEGQQVMLAGAEELDVLDEDHLLVFFVEHGGADDLLPVLGITLGQVLEGLGDALGRLEEAFAAFILAQQAQDLFDMARNLLCDRAVVTVVLPVRHGVFFGLERLLCKSRQKKFLF